MFHRDQAAELSELQKPLHDVVVAPIQGVGLVEGVDDVSELAMETSIERVSGFVVPVLASGAEDEEDR
jgi:hypothetical protein